MTTLRRSVATILITPIALPHEIAHACIAVVCGIRPEISLLPRSSSSQVVLGKFDADVSPLTPRWRIRLIAAGPVILFLPLALVIDPLVERGTAFMIAVMLFGYWGSLSGGDIVVFMNPQAVCERGQFEAPRSAWEQAPFITTPFTVLLITVILL
jgi:hypothetical protein